MMKRISLRVFAVVVVTLLIQACGNKGELTLAPPSVNKEKLTRANADKAETESDKKKNQRRE